MIEIQDRPPTPPLPPPSQYQFCANKSLSSSVKGELLDASMDDDELYSEDAMFIDSVEASPITRSKWVTLKVRKLDQSVVILNCSADECGCIR